VPLEIKQLVIKSKVIGEQSEKETVVSDEWKVDDEQNPPEISRAYYVTDPFNETRER
jgi:hypothetical protein